ncbi:MAG: DUF1822 family protein [Symploca sp. SIO2G7]|nr:DUF1822 family protein [Symploca sp. SIO2G7]
MILEELIDAYPEQLWLKFSPEEREEAWLQAQQYSNPTARRQAYFNFLCIKQLLPYWENEPDLKDLPFTLPLNDLAIGADTKLSSVWEFVNGTAITIGETRIIIVPEEISETSQLSVPQELVDIPEWAADYYLAVQVEPENCWLNILGYATHRQLKAEGTYQPLNRTYSLDGEDLTEDLNIMLIAISFRSSEKAELPCLPSLSSATAAELIEKLSQPASYSPRLNVPFEDWAALLVNNEWRKALYHRRLPGYFPTLPPLHQWFNVERVKTALNAAGWQEYGEVFDTAKEAALALRFRGSLPEQSIKWVKCFPTQSQPSIYPPVLVMNLVKEVDGTVWILPQVRPVGSIELQRCLPAGLKLTAFDEQGEPFVQRQAQKASNLIQAKQPFSNSLGTTFTLELSWNGTVVREAFSI